MHIHSRETIDSIGTATFVRDLSVLILKNVHNIFLLNFWIFYYFLAEMTLLQTKCFT